MDDLDLKLARQLQEEFDREAASTFTSPVSFSKTPVPSKSPLSIIDEHWELTDPNPDIRALFLQYNERFFWGRLAGIEVKWSPRMTLCAGLCVYEGYGGLCSVRLSTPLLKLRPRKDLVETLLHEMIHAYLFVTQNNKDHDGHGPEFQKHMNRINKETGANISIYHNFHDEVAEYRQHWWRCNGPCQKRPPYFGFVKRSMNRAPAPRDTWWADHQRTCGGTYTKVKEPEGYGQKKAKKEKDSSKEESTTGKAKNSGPDIRSFWGQGEVTGSKVTVKKPPTSTVTTGQLSSTMDDDPQLPSLSLNQPTKPGATGGANLGRNNPSHVLQTESGSQNNMNSSTSDPSRQPITSASTSGGPRLPTGKPTIKTIWDEGTKNEPKPDNKSSSGGPQICDINSVDSYKNKCENSNFEGQGHILGAGSGQGLSFLAQLRREMNTAKKHDIPEKSNLKNTVPSGPTKSDFEKDRNNFKKKVISPHSKVKSKTNSPQKSIKEWIASGSPKKSPHSQKEASPSSDFSVESCSSSNTSPPPRSKLSKKTSIEGASRDTDSLSEDDDFLSPNKPLFKKVNPASNFTSPPYRRISLYNQDSLSKHTPSGSSGKKEQSTSKDDQTERSSNETSTKRKHFGNKRDKTKQTTFKSWTSKPKYSTSDDSDVEEIKPPVKKLKTGSKEKGRSIKNSDGVITKKKHDKDDSVENIHMNRSSVVRVSGGDNSSKVTDPLQCCPVCQTKIPASQINMHLDQCLTFD